MNAVLEPRPKSGSVAVRKKAESSDTNLVVKREDIQFYNVAPDRLRIEVMVHNRGCSSSAPIAMQLQFAAFGAFVPWTPLQQLVVPQIQAGQSKLVSTEARIHPDGTLVALGGRFQAANQPSAAQRPTFLSKMAGPLSKDGKQPIQNLPTSLDPNGGPRRDIDTPRVDLHQGRSVHWVGNINVLIGDMDVERHMARAFRIYPGLINRSIFFVGDKALESYRFQISGDSAEWPTSLIRIENKYWGFLRFAQGDDLQGEQIQPSDWIKIDPIGLVGVEIRPPESAREGSLSIHVCRKSDNRTGVVEFDFSETALGPGCYTV